MARSRLHNPLTTAFSTNAPGFDLARSIAHSNYRLYRFVSARPAWVTPGRLRDRPLLPRSPDVMVGLERAAPPAS